MVDKRVWRRKHHVVSLHLVVAEANTCAPWGGACPRTFSLFFPLWKSPSKGAKCKKNTWFFLFNAPAFTFKHCESQRRSWECARAFWRIAKRIQKESFCWKCTILARCLNRVGFEFWYLSRNRKGRVSAVKCRRIFLSELGNTLNFQFKFLPFVACLPPAQALLHVLYLPLPHTHVYLPPTHLLFQFSLPSCSPLYFFTFCFYGVCLPLPLCL